MRKITTPLLMCILLIVASCGKKIEFYGDTVEVDYPEQIDTLHGRTLMLEGIYTGWMYAHDGMLLCISEKHPDGCVYLYDVATGKHINAVCPIGQGPEEVVSVYSEGCFEKDSTGIYMWLNDLNKRTVMLVDTSGKWVKRIKTSTLNSDDLYHGQVFVLNDSMLMSYSYSKELFPGKIRTPRYRLFNYTTGEMRREYRFYSEEYEEHENAQIMPGAYLHSYNVIKPDKSKIVMVMNYLNQVDIFDIPSGTAKSVRTKESPDLNFISSPTASANARRYYGGVECDDHYIYAFEVAESPGKVSALLTGKINVFDWDGNFVRILQVQDDATNTTIDPVRGILYAKNDVEEITRYDLNFLYP